MTTPDWHDWKELTLKLESIEFGIYAILIVVFIGILIFGLVITMQLSGIGKTLKARSACSDCDCTQWMCICEKCDGDIAERSN